MILLYFIILFKLTNLMLGKDFGLGGAPTQSYYFQFIPLELTFTGANQPSSDSSFRMVIYKGQQKFDESKTYNQAIFKGKKMSFNGVQLNFCLPNYSSNRKIQFVVKLLHKTADEQYQAGSWSLDSNNLVQQYKNDKQTYILQNGVQSQEYKLDYEIFIEKSRFALDRVVKQAKSGVVQSTVNSKRSNIHGSQTSSIQITTTEVKSEIRQSSVKSPSSRGQVGITKKYSKVMQPEENISAQTYNPPAQSKPQPPISNYSRKSRQLSQTSSQKKTVGYTQHKKQQVAVKQQPKKTKLKRTSSSQESIKLPSGNKMQASTFQTGVMKGSRHLYEASKQQQVLKKDQNNISNPYYLVKLIIFFIISLFLIVNAMTPSKAYNSRKK